MKKFEIERTNYFQKLDLINLRKTFFIFSVYESKLEQLIRILCEKVKKTIT
jgi:hypothetical protein